MSLRVVLTTFAEADIESLHDWIARGSHAAAERFVDQMFVTAILLADAPGVGRALQTRSRKLRGIRYRAIDGFPNHLIYYRAEGNLLRVFAVLRAARKAGRQLKQRT